MTEHPPDVQARLAALRSGAVVHSSRRRLALERPGFCAAVPAPAEHRHDAPEQIVALTFTPQAAAEMRGRVLQSLRATNDADHEAANSFSRRRELAHRARQRLRCVGLDLALHPSRLRIQTIDAFCHSLAARAALLARAGAELIVNDEPQPLYASAARHARLIEEREPIAALLLTLLAHRDNRLLQTEELLIKMLERREQWLPFVVARTRSSATRAAGADAASRNPGTFA